MRLALPLMAVLIGAAALWFVFQSEERPSSDLGVSDDGAPDTAGSGGLLTGRGPDPAADGPSKGRRPTPTMMDLRNAPRGDLTVIPVDADDNEIPIDRVKVRIASGGRQWPSQPLALRNRTTNAWEFQRIIAGPVRIICSGDTLRDTVTEARVTVRAQDPIRVRVALGGGIHWSVRHDNGALPQKLTLEVFRAGRPITGWFEERHATRMSARLRTNKAVLGHEGYVTGLQAGSYTFRATNTEDYYREVDVDVVLGEVADVKLTVRDTQDAKPAPPPAPVGEPRPTRDPSRVERNPDPPPK